MVLKDVKFIVLITFDITTDGRSDVYTKVTDHLAKEGFTKESSLGVKFPENVYYGVISRPINFNDEGNTTVGELKSTSEAINNRVIELLEQIFDFHDVKNKILVHVGRKATSTTLIK